MPEIKQSWFNRDKTEYETPDDLFRALDNEFHFTLDVAASKYNAKCSKYFTKEENALEIEWGTDEICWMNPPFGRQLKKWVQKAYTESGKGNIVVCLLPARTNTNWWHDYCMKGEIRFLKGQITFKGYERGLWMPFAVVILGKSK